MGWSIPPPAQPAAFGTGCCADGTGIAARPALAGSRRLCYAGRSYAAGYSAAGVLRWYMVLAAFAAALCTAGVLGIPLRALGRGIRAVLCLPGRILHRFAVQPLCRRRAAAKIARKLRRNAERTAKKIQKELAKPAGIVV